MADEFHNAAVVIPIRTVAREGLQGQVWEMAADHPNRQARIASVNASTKPDGSDEGWPLFEPVKWVATVEPPRGSAARKDLLQEGLEIVPKSFGELHIRCRRDFQRARVVPRGTGE